MVGETMREMINRWVQVESKGAVGAQTLIRDGNRVGTPSQPNLLGSRCVMIVCYI